MIGHGILDTKNRLSLAQLPRFLTHVIYVKPLSHPWRKSRAAAPKIRKLLFPLKNL